jgi:hypothetical protein
MRASRIRNVLLIVAAVILVVSAYLLLMQYLKGRRYENGYAQIKVGDSKESVVAKMGNPERVDICRTVSSPHDTAQDKKYQEQCVQEYWYVTFLHPYVIAFDKQSRVLAKGYQVSP